MVNFGALWGKIQGVDFFKGVRDAEPFALRPAARCRNAVFWLREVSSRTGFLQGCCPVIGR
jgi:hypothetical protein